MWSDRTLAADLTGQAHGGARRHGRRRRHVPDAQLQLPPLCNVAVRDALALIASADAEPAANEELSRA